MIKALVGLATSAGIIGAALLAMKLDEKIQEERDKENLCRCNKMDNDSCVDSKDTSSETSINESPKKSYVEAAESKSYSFDRKEEPEDSKYNSEPASEGINKVVENTENFKQSIEELLNNDTNNATESSVNSDETTIKEDIDNLIADAEKLLNKTRDFVKTILKDMNDPDKVSDTVNKASDKIIKAAHELEEKTQNIMDKVITEDTKDSLKKIRDKGIATTEKFINDITNSLSSDNNKDDE